MFVCFILLSKSPTIKKFAKENVYKNYLKFDELTRVANLDLKALLVLVKFVVDVLVTGDDPEGVPNVVRGVVPKVDPGVPSLLCGILEGVSSLLISDIIEP